MRATTILPTLLLLAPATFSAAGAPVESAYSDISGKSCTQVALDEETGSSHLRCPPPTE